jgi:hypothetical protein
MREDGHVIGIRGSGLGGVLASLFVAAAAGDALS